MERAGALDRELTRARGAIRPPRGTVGGMKLFAVLLGALALVAGFTGGLRAYSSTAHAGAPVPTAHVAAPHYPRAQVVRPGPVVRWAPCPKPSVRVGRSCVTTVTHTVTLPAPAVSAPPVAQTVAASTVRTPHVRHTQAASPRPGPTDTGGGESGGGGGHDD